MNKLFVPLIGTLLLVMNACSSDSSSNDCQAEDDSATFALLENSTTTLTMNGVIDCTTNEKLQKALIDNPIDTILMQIVEGSADDEANIAMSKQVSGQSINMIVDENGFVASGGVDFFLAGSTRIIRDNSVFAVHSWADSDGTEGIDVYNSNPSSSEHALYIDYYEQFVIGLKDGRPSNTETNIATDFYVFTLDTAPAAEIHCMTAQELVDWGIVTNTTNAAELNPVVMGGSHFFASECTR